MKIGECKLCKERKPLLKKSHIIPEFFYAQSGVYNDKHQMHSLEVQEYLKSKNFSYRYTGVYDPNILCKDCDNVLIGTLETYSRQVLFGGLNKNNQIICKNYKNPNDGAEFSLVENVDYKKFKLFLLSILWRASISNQPFFQDIVIPEVFKEKLRTMILNQDPGKFNDFPIVTLSNLRNDNIPSDMIGQPIKAVDNGNITITFLLSDFIFLFNVKPDFEDIEKIRNTTPTEEGKYGILHIPKKIAWDVILKYTNVIK
jgi:hypothetical protein